MALDPLAIATDGLLSKYKWPLSAATRGYLSQYAIVVIEIPKPRGGSGEGPPPARKDRRLEVENMENQQYQEDSEILLLIQIFMMRWN